MKRKRATQKVQLACWVYSMSFLKKQTTFPTISSHFQPYPTIYNHYWFSRFSILMFQPLLGFLKCNKIHLRKPRRRGARGRPTIAWSPGCRTTDVPTPGALMGSTSKKGMRIQRDPKGDLEMDGINGRMYIYTLLRHCCGISWYKLDKLNGI